MKMKLLYVLFMYVNICAIHAQSIEEDVNSDWKNNSIHDTVVVFQLSEFQLINSPYLLNQYVSGTVQLNSGVIFKNLPLNYNIYEDLLVRKTDNGALPIHKTTIQSFTFIDSKNKQKVHFTRGSFIDQESHQIISSFFQVLLEKDDFTILKRYKKKLRKVSNYNTHGNSTNREFINSSELYLLKNNNKIWKCKPRKKILFKIFPQDSKTLSSYLQKNKPNLSNEEEFLETLINLEVE